ncbi:MAG: D-alanine--D-alanine ligase [Chloroflexota bacterium]|nr:D-alanine--D-alanine ligase [Chloroflexota bacterium]
MAKIRVGILFGGQSSEHEVSLASARSIMTAMDPAKYEIVPIGITKHGTWLLKGDPMEALRSGEYDDEYDAEAPHAASLLATHLDNRGHAEIVQFAGSGSNGAHALTAEVSASLDVIFPVLHGPMGEDGTIQGLLEHAGIPYVGSGVLGSAVGMDKWMMKDVFTARGLPIVPHVALTRDEWESDPGGTQRMAELELRYPMFAKPSNMGSSVGVCKIHGPDEFAAALSMAARYDRRLVIEQGVDARECECAVLGNNRPEVSVVGEVVPGNEFYDYRAKYLDDNSDLFIPADLPAAISRRIRDLALRAFKAVDAAGMARVDFFVARDFSEVWLNEINTIPGFTAISMYPKLWEASGLSYPALIDRLVELAVERYGEQQRNRAALSDVGSELSV